MKEDLELLLEGLSRDFKFYSDKLNTFIKENNSLKEQLRAKKEEITELRQFIAGGNEDELDKMRRENDVLREQRGKLKMELGNIKQKIENILNETGRHRV